MNRPVVVITGASAGIGLATALAFGRAGYAVALLAREPHRLHEAARAVEAAGGAALAIAVDVAERSAVDAAAARVERELGPIAVWVNNAMATIFAPFDEITPAEYERVTRVTYLGTVNGTRAALRYLRTRDHGCIVQVGSALAYRSIPLQSAYCGAKAAIRGFSDALRSELIHERSQVRICMVQLCAFNTPQFDWGASRLSRRPQPVGPVYQPELAARAIVWLAQHPRRELWVGMPAIVAILSTRLFAALGDRLAAARAWRGQHSDEPAAPRNGNLFAPLPAAAGLLLLLLALA